MLSKYPNFTKLELVHKDYVKNFTREFAPFSDFNFTSLFCWNVDSTIELSQLHGNLVVRMPDYLDGHLIYSILGNTKIDESISILLETAGKLELVPETVIDALENKTTHKIIEDRNNFDYIYNLSHLSELEGNKFKKKRNKANVFVKDHDDLEVVVRVTRNISYEDAERFKKVDREWAQLTSRDEGDILAERVALGRFLDNANHFQPIVIEILIDGEIKAFSINEFIDGNNGYAICHFEKALKAHHEHLNTFLTIEVARKLREAGCSWVNWEQDMGLEGLRQSKLSYHPANMLKKYTISQHHTN